MTIALQVGLDVITSYKRLAYTPWHAIAEFVDNSTQSYFDHKVELDGVAEDRENPLHVTIEYEPSQDLLRVTDNAMGMSYEELEKALHVAQPPVNTSGRSKYGMGLKTAACWIGNLWTVKTKKLGESTEHFVTIDVTKIASGENELPHETFGEVPENKHYTVIEVKQHNRKFKGRTLSKIRQYLSSMYRQDFRDNILRLEWRGEVLDWVEFDDRLLRDHEGNLYKKNFEFEFFDEVELKPKRVYGWVGIFRDGSRTNAGFSILHSNRVVKGWPDSWRPTTLYGPQASNDLVNQRLVGEVHLDDFEVSHTKDDILWLGDQEEKVEQGLQEDCMDYREIARTFRKTREDQRGPTEVETNIAVSELERELTSPEMSDLIRLDPMLPPQVVEQVVKSVKESVVNQSFQRRFEAKINGLTIMGYVEEDMSPNDPYVTVDSAKISEVIIIVNASHPHWSQLLGAKGVLNYLRHCTYDGIAEWQARHKTARLDPDTIKLLKDKLLRLALEIEHHEYREELDRLDELDSRISA